MAMRFPQVGPAIRKAFLVLAFLAVTSGGWARQTTPVASSDAGIVQQLGSSVTLDLGFLDEQGAAITLAQASGGRPFILALVYYRCPMLCNLILNGLLETLLAMGPTAGEDFNVVTVSFDPTEGPDLARAKKAHYLRAYGRPAGAAGWRFLSDDGRSARRLCEEAGFRISYDPRTRLYGHASAILVVTPGGRISRYFMGVDYPARDLRLSLVEASAGKIGRAADRLLLLCLEYDPVKGKYTLAVWRILRGLGIATVLGITALIALLSRRRPPPQGVPRSPGPATSPGEG
jgi:protein SCO1/2